METLPRLLLSLLPSPLPLPLTPILPMSSGPAGEGIWQQEWVSNRLDDVVGFESDVLDSSTPVIVHIFLDLGLLLAQCWLVDGHLDGLLIVGHHDGAQRAVFCVHLCVIHRPETVKLQVLEVPVGGRWRDMADLSAS